MGSKDEIRAIDSCDAQVIRGGGMAELLQGKGVFKVDCYDKDGNLKWSDEFPNTVVTVGKNFILDTVLSGSGYTHIGPYMGLISSASFSAIAAADTMTSHAGWLEAGNANAPTYSGARRFCAFNAAAAGSISLTAALSFAITGSGTVKGGFIVLGTGAVGTVDNTGGTLLSAGLFTGGDKVVANLDTLNVSYSLSLT